jgi:hypothetical protein
MFLSQELISTFQIPFEALKSGSRSPVRETRVCVIGPNDVWREDTEGEQQTIASEY